jgi:spectrin beta
MLARITADELAKDVTGAESLINRHKENKAEIDARVKDVTRFTQKGKALIAERNFLSSEIQDKIDHLNHLFDSVSKTWQSRKVLYEQSLDLELLKREMDQLDTWLNIRKPVIDDTTLGDSIDAVEELLHKHEDFEKMIFAQEERFSAINRKTLLETAFVSQKKQEELQRLEEEKRREKERLEEMKRREQDRILEERRREEEQRKAQEILMRRRRDFDEGEPADVKKPSEVAVAEPKDLITAVEPSESDKADLSAAVRPGLVTSDAWADSPATKKVSRTDSQKKEKRQRTLSLKAKKSSTGASPGGLLREYRAPETLPPVEMEGMLERKHEFQSGGKSATFRSWKHYYVVLCGQLLCFFKDHDSYVSRIAATAPLPLRGAKCESAADYTKKKNVIRLTLPDKSVYLFNAVDASEMSEWQTKIQFHAALLPAFQLMAFDSDLAHQLSHEDDAQRLSSQGSDASGESQAMQRRSVTATLSDPTQADSGLPPTGHIRIKARPAAEVAELPEEPGRVAGRRQVRTEPLAAVDEYQFAEPKVLLPGSRQERPSDRKASLTDAPPLPATVPPPASIHAPSVDLLDVNTSLSSGRSSHDGATFVPTGSTEDVQSGGRRKSRPSAADEQKYSQPHGAVPYDAGSRNGVTAASEEQPMWAYDQPHPSGKTPTYTVSATLPVGVSPTYDLGASSTAVHAPSATLERETKSSSVSAKGGKPMTAAQLAAAQSGAEPPAEKTEKEKKRGSHLFSGIFGKGKKEKDAKK